MRNESLHESFLNSHLISQSTENKSYMRVEKREFAWELMRVNKREFAGEFSQLSCPVQTRTRVTWELMRVDKWEFAWEFLNSHVPFKLEQELHESWWELSVCMRVFSVCMRVFSTLMCPVQTRTRVTWELMRVDERLSMRVEKWEFAWEFSQLSCMCPVQTRTRVTWELTGYDCARCENSLQSRAWELAVN
jgi:hypothetical protein